MYFLNRKEITEFQNKCVIAMFLDSHRDLFLKEYIGKNQFKAINLEGNTITINLFQNVTKISKSNNVIHVYLTRKSTYKKEACIYYVLDDDFIRKYKEFVQNPFIYIIHAFKNNKWQYKYETLFYNDSLSLPTQLCKYISDPIDKEDVIERFEKFMKGTVTFVNPKTCNDPFDCDCELDFEEKFKYVFEMSLIKTKYDKTAIELNKNDIDQFVNDVLHKGTVKFSNRVNRDVLNIDRNEYRSINVESDENMSSSIAKFKDYDQEELHDPNFIKLLLIILFDHLGRRINDEKLESITNYFVEMWNSFANIKEDFRILCLAQNPKDILMWGYYGNGGTGVCNTYNSEILKQDIENGFTNEICIYDLVTYSSDDTLPSISSKNKDLQDNIFQYIADCVFTKYKAWNHEKEFRFVLIDNDFGEDYLAMQTTVKNHYFGCKYESVDYYHNHGYDTKYKINSLKLCKHKNRYELVEEKFKRGH